MFNFLKKKAASSNEYKDTENLNYDYIMEKISKYLHSIREELHKDSKLNILLDQIKNQYTTSNDEEKIFYNETSTMLSNLPSLKKEMLELNQKRSSLTYHHYIEMLVIYYFINKLSDPLPELDKKPEVVSISISRTIHFMDTIKGNHSDYYIPELIFQYVHEGLSDKMALLSERKLALTSKDPYGYEDASKWNIEKESLADNILGSLPDAIIEILSIDNIKTTYKDVITSNIIEDLAQTGFSSK